MLEMLSREPFYFRWEVALVQMAGFLMFFVILKVFLFDRLLAFIRLRDEDLKAAGRRAAETRREIERHAADLRAKLAAADKAAYEEMQKVVKEGIAAKTAVLQAAQEESRRILDDARRAIAAEKDDALRAMDAQVRALGAEVAASATGGARASADFAL